VPRRMDVAQIDRYVNKRRARQGPGPRSGVSYKPVDSGQPVAPLISVGVRLHRHALLDYQADSQRSDTRAPWASRAGRNWRPNRRLAHALLIGGSSHVGHAKPSRAFFENLPAETPGRANVALRRESARAG